MQFISHRRIFFNEKCEMRNDKLLDLRDRIENKKTFLKPIWKQVSTKLKTKFLLRESMKAKTERSNWKQKLVPKRPYGNIIFKEVKLTG